MWKFLYVYTRWKVQLPLTKAVTSARSKNKQVFRKAFGGRPGPNSDPVLALLLAARSQLRRYRIPLSPFRAWCDRLLYNDWFLPTAAAPENGINQRLPCRREQRKHQPDADPSTCKLCQLFANMCPCRIRRQLSYFERAACVCVPAAAWRTTLDVAIYLRRGENGVAVLWCSQKTIWTGTPYFPAGLDSSGTSGSGRPLPYCFNPFVFRSIILLIFLL